MRPTDTQLLPFNFQSRPCPLPQCDTVQIKQTEGHGVGECTVCCCNHPEQAKASTWWQKKKKKPPAHRQKYYFGQFWSNPHWLSCFDHLDKTPSQSFYKPDGIIRIDESIMINDPEKAIIYQHQPNTPPTSVFQSELFGIVLGGNISCSTVFLKSSFTCFYG